MAKISYLGAQIAGMESTIIRLKNEVEGLEAALALADAVCVRAKERVYLIDPDLDQDIEAWEQSKEVS